ncbi:MAG: hypothetical protein ACI8RW_001408, partial [Porticoccaceae bacterium]
TLKEYSERSLIHGIRQNGAKIVAGCVSLEMRAHLSIKIVV